MASAASPYDPVSAEDVLTMQFTLIKKGGYDSQEVDAFLDRVAATLDRCQGQLPAESLTGDDVRSVEFSMVKRGGYATREVDDFLDRVVAVLGSISEDASMAAPVVAGVDVFDDLDFDMGADHGDFESDDDSVFGADVVTSAPPAPPVVTARPAAPAPEPAPPAPAPEPETVAPAPPVASVPASPEPEPVSPGVPRLHDPGGAAQKLLAAAQQAADTLTADANAYSEQLRRDADEYAAATRLEADEHAERVTASAEAQAASIREVAADEARRVAEEARNKLVDEIAALEARKTGLETAVDQLDATVSAHRGELVGIVDDLRARIEETLSTGSPDAPPIGRTAPADAPAPPGPVEVQAAPEGREVGAAATADDVNDVGGDVADVGLTQQRADDAAVSVFELADEDQDAVDTSADRADEATSAAGDEAPTALFDIEADDEMLTASSPETPPTDTRRTDEQSGQSFFDELRQADDDGGLGPLDDDTDAALSAFFDTDEEPSEGRWRDRFGPGRN